MSPEFLLTTLVIVATPGTGVLYASALAFQVLKYLGVAYLLMRRSFGVAFVALAGRPALTDRVNDRPVDLTVGEPAGALLDEPFLLRARARDAGDLFWRARFRDDAGRVWRAGAATAEGLTATWAPAKPGATRCALLHSLRPVAVDVRVEAPGGQAAARTLTRRLLGEGVRRRRWRDGLTATLHLPAEPPGGVAVLDAVGDADDGAAATLAAPLLASRGVLTLAVTHGEVGAAVERLAALPAAGCLDPVVVGDVPLPPNAGAGGDGEAWDELLARVGARPRAAPPSGWRIG